MTPFFLVYFRLRADGPRARPRQGRPDRRRQPPQLPRPVRDRRHPALAAADELRRQGRALRAPLAGLDPLPPRRLPDPPRRVRRGVGGDRPHGRRARRHRLHLPRGHPDPHRLAGDPEARRRAPRAADRRAGDPGRGARHRTRAPRLADPPAQGQGPARQGDDLPARRRALAGPGGDGHRADLAQRRAAVGGPRRPAADAPRRGDRRRQLGHRGRRAARPRRPRRAARHPHRRAGRRAQRGPRERAATCPGVAPAGLAARQAGGQDRARRPRPRLPRDPLRLAAAGGRARSPTGSASAPRCCC